MPVSDYFLILNPTADRGRAERVLPALERALRAEGARYELVHTRRAGHAVALAEAAVEEGWRAVVAIGGDGVVHEVANGLLRAAGDNLVTPMGVVPAGSGNDFVKLLGIPPRDAEAAARRITRGEPRPVDVGRVPHMVARSGPRDPWHFVNGVGLGFDAQVALEASRVRRVRGLAIYAVAVLRTLRRLGAPHIRVVVDGEEVADRELILATIANGACHGGSFWLTPDASVDDGLLDVLVADRRGLAAVLALIPRVLRGRHLGARGVELRRGTRVSVRSDTPLPIHADGEIIASGVSELDVELLPGRLRVLR